MLKRKEHYASDKILIIDVHCILLKKKGNIWQEKLSELVR